MAEEREATLRVVIPTIYPGQIMHYLEGLSLIGEALDTTWQLSGDNVAEYTRERLILMLATVAEGNCKVALDAVLGCQYPTAYASERLVVETALALVAIQVDHKISERWYGVPAPGNPHLASPKTGELLTAIRGAAKRGDSWAEAWIPWAESQDKLCYRLSIGVHPVVNTFNHLLSTDGATHRHPPQFNKPHSNWSLSYGLMAIDTVLDSLEDFRVGHAGQLHQQQIADWARRYQAWHATSTSVISELLSACDDPLMEVNSD